MIFVDRSRLDDKGKPIKPSADWDQLATTQTETAKIEGAAHQVSDLYSHVEVKKALEELFYRKCAYCEQPLGEEWDVEHYRPKGSVAERPDHSGYYWLAYTWTNLYASCKHCNQLRKDAPLWRDRATGPPAGKLDQFPLADESKRTTNHLGAIDAEEPLLLDPCSKADKVETRFIYDPKGAIAPASAGSGLYLFVADPQGKLQAPGSEDERAKATIGICHLNRRRLKDWRAEAMARVSAMHAALAEAQATDPASTVVTRLQNMIADEIRDGAPFAGAARYVLRDPAAFVP